MLHRPRALAPLLLAAALLTACSSGGSDAPEDARVRAGGAAATGSPTTGTSGGAGTVTTDAAGPSGSPTADASPRPLAQLPRGGRSIFPRHEVVMYYGTARTGALGVLGETSPEAAARRLEKAAAPFGPASGRTVLPAFELITTVASSRPGPDGLYSSRLDPGEVRRYLAAARQAKQLLVLDFQPGRATFLEQVKAYEEFLLQPDVGVALDPEWKLTASQRPLRQIGTSTAAPINAVSSYLAGLTLKNRLPEKIFMVHQFKSYQLPDRAEIVDRPGLATVLHVDGFGAQGSKKETYGILHSRTKQFVNGFKLFYDEDTDLMTAVEAMAVTPRPELISYQ